MTQNERRIYLLKQLIKERSERIELPKTIKEQEALLRALMNVREPKPIDEAFLVIQDAYLQTQVQEKGIVEITSMELMEEGIYLWRGDITRLAVDAIVNAANAYMLGCFIPGHKCIDNAIHSASGIQLRLVCHDLMMNQQTPEPCGCAKLTKAYNLPSRYIIHTVGPIIHHEVSRLQRDQLASCYLSSLEVAWKHQLYTIAFPCISTGEFHFPNLEAAQIATHTVRAFRKKHPEMQVIFNVFKVEDEEIYRNLLEKEIDIKNFDSVDIPFRKC